MEIQIKTGPIDFVQTANMVKLNFDLEQPFITAP